MDARNNVCMMISTLETILNMLESNDVGNAIHRITQMLIGLDKLRKHYEDMDCPNPPPP